MLICSLFIGTPCLGKLCFNHGLIDVFVYKEIFFQEEIVRYKKQYEDMLTERNKFKQQCTQVWIIILHEYTKQKIACYDFLWH